MRDVVDPELLFDAIQLLGLRGSHHPGIGDHRVELASEAVYFPYGRVDRGEVAQIARHRRSAAAGAGDSVARRLFRARQRDHVGAVRL